MYPCVRDYGVRIRVAGQPAQRRGQRELCGAGGLELHGRHGHRLGRAVESRSDAPACCRATEQEPRCAQPQPRLASISDIGHHPVTCCRLCVGTGPTHRRVYAAPGVLSAAVPSSRPTSKAPTPGEPRRGSPASLWPTRPCALGGTHAGTASVPPNAQCCKQPLHAVMICCCFHGTLCIQGRSAVVSNLCILRRFLPACTHRLT